MEKIFSEVVVDKFIYIEVIFYENLMSLSMLCGACLGHVPIRIIALEIAQITQSQFFLSNLVDLDGNYHVSKFHGI